MTAWFNYLWAKLILHTLRCHGISTVFIGPGSRATPLIFAIADSAELVTVVHVDERSLAYAALGAAKASRKPVAVIVTSGTAVANLYPALIEASCSGTRIVFISADRPPESLNCGENQTIFQSGIFKSDYLAGSVMLPRPSTDIAAKSLRAQLDAVLQSQPGPIHINCPFPEPLYPDVFEETESMKNWKAGFSDFESTKEPWYQKLSGDPQLSTHPLWNTYRNNKGVIIIGNVHQDAGIAIQQWALLLGWPVLIDIQSSCRAELPYYDLWIKHPVAKALLNEAQIVIQFGSRLISKALQEWLASWEKPFWHITPFPTRTDPHHHKGIHFCVEPIAWLAMHSAISCTPWAPRLKAIAQCASDLLRTVSLKNLDEITLALTVTKLLPEGGALFVGNSTMIRCMNSLVQFTQPRGYPVYANRGTSGIDGTLSTAIGVQLALQVPLLLVIGDLALLYDLNAMMLLNKVQHPFVILVVNNHGGSIFKQFPIPATLREKYYENSHSVTFKAAATLFSLEYAHPHTIEELLQQLNATWNRADPCAIVLEMTTSGSSFSEMERLREALYPLVSSL